ncbi:hypothetical protein [Rickettsia endosymbiont of Ceutorhynchus obstrictus]|uniref:hypothetical protein n=1 Tax=Rickettsia endosymbiont of Ceutorhynchus obstrictus TaxID=3066249 RepID=UPI003132EBC2
MPKSNLQMVLEESHSRFLIRNIDNNLETITKWVEENLIKDNPNTNAQSKIAFYEAEKDLIIEYIMENNFQTLKSLINAIDHEQFHNNQKLKINECRVLANAIIEAQKYRCVQESGSAMHSDLNKLLRTKYQELTDETYKSKISGIVEQALLIVCHKPSTEVTTIGDDGPSGSMVDTL